MVGKMILKQCVNVWLVVMWPILGTGGSCLEHGPCLTLGLCSLEISTWVETTYNEA